MFLDVSVAGEYIGRIEIELYPDCPKTVKNFRKICNGTK
jgi:cyclophilin family peptidyl-prolyl cis-trans isomerase